MLDAGPITEGLNLRRVCDMMS